MSQSLLFSTLIDQTRKIFLSHRPPPLEKGPGFSDVASKSHLLPIPLPLTWGGLPVLTCHGHACEFWVSVKACLVFRDVASHLSSLGEKASWSLTFVPSSSSETSGEEDSV